MRTKLIFLFAVMAANSQSSSKIWRICAINEYAVKASAKSSHHEDCATVLTFGLFGSAFCVMNAQKSAFLADLLSTFYKVGIVGS